MVLTPGVNEFDSEAILNGQWAADADFASDVDSIGHAPNADGRITYAALIPGATYELRIGTPDRPMGKSFVVKAGESTDLGQFTVKSISRFRFQIGLASFYR